MFHRLVLGTGVLFCTGMTLMAAQAPTGSNLQPEPANTPTPVVVRVNDQDSQATTSDQCHCATCSRGGQCGRAGRDAGGGCGNTCNMPQHQAYYPQSHGNYYFQPYNYSTIRRHQETVVQWGGDPKNPYDNSMFNELYKEFDKPEPAVDLPPVIKVPRQPAAPPKTVITPPAKLPVAPRSAEPAAAAPAKPVPAAPAADAAPDPAPKPALKAVQLAPPPKPADEEPAPAKPAAEVPAQKPAEEKPADEKTSEAPPVPAATENTEAQSSVLQLPLLQPAQETQTSAAMKLGYAEPVPAPEKPKSKIAIRKRVIIPASAQQPINR